MKRNNKFNSIFIKIFLSSILVVFVPVIIISGIFYNNSIESKKHYYSEFYFRTLENGAKNLADIFTSIENQGLNLIHDDIFYNFIRMNKPGEYVSNLSTLRYKLQEIKINYDFINSIYFYDPNYNCIITNLYGTYDVDSFYDNEWITQFDYKNKMQRLSIRKSYDYEKFAIFKNMLVYEDIYSIVIQLNKQQLICINISLQKLCHYINKNYFSELENFQVIDKKNTIILSHSYQSSQKLGNDLFFSIPILYNDWHISSYLPKSILYKELKYFKQYVVFLCAIILAVSIIISYLISRLLSNGIKNKLLVYETATKHHLLLNFILEKICIEEFKNESHKIGLILDYQFFKLLILSRPKASNLETEKSNLNFSVLESMNDHLHEKGIFFGTNKHYYLTVITTNSKESIKFTEKELVSYAKSNFSIGCFIGESEIIDNIMDLPIAYATALECIKYGEFFQIQDNFINTNMIPCEIFPIVPVNIEAGILRAIILDKQDDIIKIISCYIKYISEKYSVNAAKQATNKLITTIDKEFSFTDIFTDNVYEEIECSKNIECLKNELIYIFNSILEHRKKLEPKENQYVLSAKEYIENHYKETFNLTSISDTLNISYPYLSKLFKEHTGDSILDYLNNIRIEKSKILLKETNQTIICIAEELGFSNHQSYQRFFKKITGLTPGDFRKLP